MMCRTNFWRMIGWVTTWGMNWLQTLVNVLLCERATLLTVPWLMFFKAPVTPAEPWSLSTGMATILLSVLVTSLPRCERYFRSSLGSSP